MQRRRALHPELLGSHSHSHTTAKVYSIGCGLTICLRCLPQQATWMSLDDEAMTYKPTVFFNDFWLMRKHLVPVNETVTELPLHLSLSGMGNWKFMLYVQMDQSFSMQARCLVCPGPTRSPWFLPKWFPCSSVGRPARET